MEFQNVVVIAIIGMAAGLLSGLPGLGGAIIYQKKYLPYCLLSSLSKCGFLTGVENYTLLCD